MSQRYDPRDRRFRRSLAGRPIPRRRPLPGMLHGMAPARNKGMPAIVSRLLLALVLLAGLMSLGGAGSAYGAYAQLANSLKPRLEQIAKHDSFQTTRIYDRNNVLLYEFFGAGKRTRVKLDQIEPLLVQATIAIEDKTFFENQGVDFEGMLKALYRSASAGEETGGASTITQQLIKSVVLNDEERAYENRYRRKMTEIILARELTQQYTKEEILELYLNEIYYGNLAYGIEAAAEVYFDKHANELTLAEASLLAGLPQLPSYYDPINYLEGQVLNGVRLEDGWLEPSYEFSNGTPSPKQRQAAVLTQMVDEGYVSEQDARRAAAEDLVFADQEVPLNAPHFVFYVRKLLEEQYGPQFANQGLSIYTTLDLEMQRMVQQKAAERIQELEERNIHNAAVVVMQPNSGQILAMVGSIDYNKEVPTSTRGEKGNVLDGQVNVTTRERQPGSALKPFTYLAAMKKGMTPASVIWDVPTKYPLVGGRWYEPQNYNGRWNGPVRIRTALANSLNMPAVKALKFAGVNDTIELLHNIGIGGLRRGDQHYGLALTLGGGEVTPLDLTGAYNTLASGGTYYPPMAILKIVDGNGNVTELKPQPRPKAIDSNHAAIITNMLSDDNARRPVWGLNSKLKLSRPAAVKTGTTNDWRDAWAVGFTPYVTVGVWTGNNNNEPTAKVESLSGGGVIWHNVMEELFSNERFDALLRPGGKPGLDFTLPSEVERKSICALPGPFGGYKEELFAPDMLKRPAAPSGSGTANEQPASGDRFGCDIYSRLTVAALGGTPIAATENVSGTSRLALAFCIPQEGQQIPDELLRTIYVPNLPESDPSEKVEYRWGGFGGEVDGRIVAAVDPGQIPPCSDSLLAAIAPPGSVRMPDLRMLGENQAKERLAGLGVGNIYVDYQTRERIPDVYDQHGPYVVLSTLPAPGEWIAPGSTVVLGIRAPDPEPPPADQPATP